ncbi:hypothetical protein AB4099_18540 [Bosea sp. 2KB_26]|uniref:hypothetical protein n=1 Tax=Bosea sp. 2KB_26 TaxID=3237475 RepID=UPI003F90CE88
MSAWRQRAETSRWVAVAVAYLLVLQVVLTGLASGANAASIAFDRTLAITLCSPSAASPGDTTDRGTAQHDLMSGCALGCSHSTHADVPSAIGYLPVVYRIVDRNAFIRRLDAPHGFVAGRSPANPRAPPV